MSIRPLLLLLFMLSAQAAGMDTAFAAYQQGNHAQALQTYRKLAEQGNSLAQFNYAMMLKRGEGAADHAAWLPWLEKAAAGRVMNASYALGLAYEHGDGVAISQTEATRWFEIAARQGHTQAQVSVATQYFLGRGAPKDYLQAAKWYEKAAEGGEIGAQYLIASMYEHGDGVKADPIKALEWYTAAARQGDPAAKLKAALLAKRP